MRRNRIYTKNTNTNRSEQRSVVNVGSPSSSSSRSVTFEEIKTTLENLKNGLKSQRTFASACEEITKLVPQCLNEATRRLFYDILNVASYRIGRPGFSAQVAQPMFQAVYDRIDCMTPGFRKYIIQWKEVVDYMANTGQNTIPPSIPSHELDGRFGTQRPSSSLRRSSRSFNLQTALANFMLFTLLPSLQQEESSSESSTDSVTMTGYQMSPLMFNTNVLVDIPFSQYPFCEFTLELTKPCQLKMNKSKGGLYATLNYTLNSKIFEQLKSEATKTQVKLCVLDCTSSAPKCVRPPPTLSYTINNNAVNFSSLNSVLEIAYGADITSYSRQGKNTIEIYSPSSWPSFEYLSFAVRMVRIISIEDLITKKKETSTLPYATCVQRVKDSFKKSDTDVEEERIKLTLRCPLSLTRIQVPVRGFSCSHIQCFDLGSYLQINKSYPTFKCPICNQTRPYNDLFVDSYFEKILCEVKQEVDEVVIERDCTWKIVESDENISSQNEDTVDFMNPTKKRKHSNDDEISNQTNESFTSPSKRSRPNPIVIEID